MTLLCLRDRNAVFGAQIRRKESKLHKDGGMSCLSYDPGSTLLYDVDHLRLVLKLNKIIIQRILFLCKNMSYLQMLLNTEFF